MDLDYNIEEVKKLKLWIWAYIFRVQILKHQKDMGVRKSIDNKYSRKMEFTIKHTSHSGVAIGEFLGFNQFNCALYGEIVNQ